MENRYMLTVMRTLFNVTFAMIGYRPKNPVIISNDAEREEIEALLEAIDADDDVQNVYVRLAG